MVIFPVVVFLTGFMLCVVNAETRSQDVTLENLAPESISKIESFLLSTLASETEADYFVWMKEKADLSPASLLKSKREKSRFVYEALVETAEQTQQPIRAYLNRQGIPYRPFYIANKILIQKGDANLLANLASRPDVNRVTANHVIRLQEPFRKRPAPLNVLAVEPGISMVNADDVWALGYTGSGIVLAGNDTGLDETHPTIQPHYRGWNGLTYDHNYNWWDATGTYALDPFDGHGHGTHTTGTMVGDDGGANQIGMAPGAQCIHCKNMTDGGTGTDATFSECFEWDLAPWDLTYTGPGTGNPNPDLAPHVVNNSWGYWGGGDDQFDDEITALQAAGILVEVSAGNEGDACSTLRSPADYADVLTTGSVSYTSGMPGTISSFSSRGPSSLFPLAYFPDIMAPGEDIISSLPGNTYGSWSGTSMAGPHTSGLIALMWEACPKLEGDIATTVQIIQDTAVPLAGQAGSNCGGDYIDGPNNDWGYGTIDALAAVAEALAICEAATIEGNVSSGGVPISGARITAISGGYTKTVHSNASGDYSMAVPAPYIYDISAYAYGYISETISGISVSIDEIITQDFDLSPAPMVTVSGTVTDTDTGWALYAKVDIIADGFTTSVYTDPVTGEYSIDLVQDEEVIFVVNAVVDGYLMETRLVIPPSGGATEDFALGGTVNAPGYSMAPIYFDDFEGGFGSWTPTGLWNLETDTDTCGSSKSPFPSPSHSAYYGNDGTCTYNTGAENSGTLTLNTPVTIPIGGAVLSFWSYEQTECNGDCPYDNRFVEVSDDGGSTWTLLGECGSEGAWYQKSFNLTVYAGADILIRFSFDSGDDIGNNFFGWMIDDVAVLAGVAPDSGGLVVGNVYDENTGMGVNDAGLDDSSGDSTTSFSTPDDSNVDDGMYILYLPTSRDMTATAIHYGDVTHPVTVINLGVVKQDFYLPAGQLSCPTSIVQYIMPNTTLNTVKQFENTGTMALNYDIFEFEGAVTVTTRALSNLEDVKKTPATINRFTYRDQRGLDRNAIRNEAPTIDIPRPAKGVLALGDILDSWPDGLTYAWGIGVDLLTNDLWLGNIGAGGGDDLDYRFLTNGTNTGNTIDTSGWIGAWAADMTYDWVSKMLWQLDVGGDNCIHELDPRAMVPTGNTICPPLGISQRGLAYDPITDTFFAGSWNDSSIHHFDRSGTILETTFVGIPISGLAFHPKTGHLFCLTSGGTYDMEVLDVNDNYNVVDQFDIAGFGDGAGLGIDCGGNLWAVDQGNHLVFQIDSNEGGIGCAIPWLSESPASGTIAASSSQDVTFTFDSTGFGVGETAEGTVMVQNSTPYGTILIPVEMHVVSQTYNVVFQAGANGTIQGDLFQVVLENGDCTAVTALPDAGCVFMGWSGDYSGIENPLTITNVTANMTITANFAPLYTVTFVAGTNGSITGDLIQEVPEGSDCMAVTAIPEADYDFDGWTGDFTGTTNPLTITNVTSDMTIRANFVEEQSPPPPGGRGGGCFLSTLLGD